MFSYYQHSKFALIGKALFLSFLHFSWPMKNVLSKDTLDNKETNQTKKEVCVKLSPINETRYFTRNDAGGTIVGVQPLEVACLPSYQVSKKNSHSVWLPHGTLHVI